MIDADSFEEYILEQSADSEIRFENSTVQYLVKQHPDKKKYLLPSDEDYTTQWFNETVPYPYFIGTMKMRKGFSFTAVIKAPTRLPIWSRYLELGEIYEGEHVAIVFNMPDFGKWVIHNRVEVIDTHSLSGPIIFRRLQNPKIPIIMEDFKTFTMLTREELAR